MKAWILIAGLATAGFVSNANAEAQSPEIITSVISQRTALLPVDISMTKVKLSRADYSVPMVKVLVPALADVTLLDHRNTGEGAPCLATRDTPNPESIIQNKPETETIPFTITLEKTAFADRQAQTCNIVLAEKIEGTIRGFRFTHERYLDVGKRHIEDCR